MINKFIIFLVSSIFFNLSTFANQGLDIAKKVDKANEGFVGEVSNMEMILLNAQGDKIVRKMTSKVKEVPSDGDKSLSIFHLPKDVEGTKMLTWTHKKDDDDQWLFMPSLKRVKRIHANNKTASFMGSEFSYEDLGSQEVEKYNYKFLKDEKENGDEFWVIERTPLNKKSGYKKQVVKISKKYMSAVEVQYFNKRDELLKVATFSDFKPYTINGKKMFRANKIHMINKLTKKESILTWQDRTLGKDLSNNEFKKEGLSDTF
ncbi:MAG: outer membrane lipoprotein-sorting protein [Halobacteriovoraceae bacterium]|nr:outer membrane lipoprotein-sorting protein [Halobacteriovoraceae bacterium]